MKPVIKVTNNVIFRALKPSFSSISSIMNASKGPNVRLLIVNKDSPAAILRPYIAKKVQAPKDKNQTKKIIINGDWPPNLDA